ncbi:MAG TPA: isocitrate lyase/phosphoenolpyruvate mutase family protein [Thermoleophilaceae bacterium]|nr:isocitrate lyase/phosphoenolpyruvate mutase family protein [Thermoleophilaceae bacterium]
MSRRQVADQTDLESRCERLRSLHAPGAPLVLPNAWDVSSARAVVGAGFPVVATTSGGVAAALGYEDHEQAPSDEMFAAAARIARAVDVPVTVDAEAGYGLEPADLVATLKSMAAAGCNVEDTDHAKGELRDPAEHADWLHAVREAASDQGYGVVINARIDVFLPTVASGPDAGSQADLVPEALRRANAYMEVGADCVFPILLWERDALAAFISEAPGPVNVLRIPPAPSLAALAELGVARVSYGGLLHRRAMEEFSRLLGSLGDESA